MHVRRKKVGFMENNKLFRIPNIVRNKTNISTVKEVKRIAVISIGGHTGVSFVTGLLAASFSKRSACEEEVSLVELGSSYFYEAYGIEKRFIQRDFICFYDILSNKGQIKGFTNSEDNINWILRCPFPQFQEHIDIAAAFRLIHNVSGTLLFFDCSAVPENHLWEILPEMDVIVAVIDPLPSKMIPQGPFIQRLRFTFPQTVFVVNKMNKGVHRGELNRFLDGIDFFPLPLVDAAGVYKAEYNCILPYSITDIKKEVEKPLQALTEVMIHTANT